MSETELRDKKEAVGQLFGLFGVTEDSPQREQFSNQTEEGELIDTDFTFGQNSHQNIEINENECIVCHSKDLKYRCPKCQIKTCSLNCCRTHKTRFNCDGIREKLSFVKMSDFSQQDFLTDYFFLEDVDRGLDNTTRERRSIINSKMILPKWLQKLIREARMRGINLKIMPGGFSRRKRNTTCFMYNEKTILWDVELKFIHALDTKNEEELNKILTEDLVVSHSEYSYIKPRVPENTKLCSLLSEFIESNDLIQSSNKLCLYRKHGMEGLTVLLSAENRGSKQQKYFELDVNKSIKEVLKGKTVIEFPIFFVILNKFKHLFEFMSEEVVNKSEN